MFEKQLVDIGLGEKEAAVYVATLELGRGTAQEIAKKAGLKRPTTYFTIQSLMGMGLMSSVHEGKKQNFMAETPERLVDVFNAKQDELRRQGEKLKKIIPDLKKIAQKEIGPIVKYYTGKEGALNLVKGMLKSASGKNVWMAYPADKVTELFSREELDSVKFNRNKRDIKIRAFYTSNKREIADDRNSLRIKVDPKTYPISSDIAVYGDSVRFVSYDSEPIGIIVENKNIAETMRTIFKLAWKNKA